MKQRVISLEDRLQQLADEAAQQRDLRLIISQLEDFVAEVRGGLATADWRTRREIIRALVRRVEIDQQHISVVFRVPPTSTNSDPDGGILPDCRRGGYSTLWRSFSRMRQHPLLKNPRLEPLIDQFPDDSILHPFVECSAEIAMLDRPEIIRDV